MYDAPGSDSKSEWVELQNTGDSPVDISRWKFNDGSNHVLNAPPKNGSTGSLMMAPGGFLILAADANTFEASHSVGVSIIDTVMNLPNANGVIELLDASSTIEDKVSYTNSKGGNGTGESLQMVNGKLIAAAPTPGKINSSVRIGKPAVVSAGKAASKKAATKAKPGILDGTSTVVADISGASEPTTTAMAAAAVVPVGTSGGSLMPWVYGVLALGVAVGGAVLVARQKRKGEWDIEEIV